MVRTFQTRIVQIQAVQFTGHNFGELTQWSQNSFRHGPKPYPKTHEGQDLTAEVFDKLHNAWIGVAPGQWIVRGAKGEYYPCDDETFHWKYEEVTAPVEALVLQAEN